MGYVRPIFGSIPGIAELQSRYAALVFAGKRPLPAPQERGLVDHFLYSDQLATLIGCRPPLSKLLFSSPRKGWEAISSLWNGCQFWLHDGFQHERIFQTFARYRDNQVSEVYTFLMLAPFLPLIGMSSSIRISLKEHLFGVVPRPTEPFPAEARPIRPQA